MDVFWTDQHLELAAGLLDLFDIPVTFNAGTSVMQQPGLGSKLGESAFPGYPRCCCARTIRATTYMKARECRLNRHFPIPASANAIVWCKNIHSSNFPLDRRQVLPKL
jgi:hypothetical protein